MSGKNITVIEIIDDEIQIAIQLSYTILGLL